MSGELLKKIYCERVNNFAYRSREGCRKICFLYAACLSLHWDNAEPAMPDEEPVSLKLDGVIHFPGGRCI